MSQRSIRWIQDEEPGLIPWEYRLYGNKTRIEREVKFGEQHQDVGGIGVFVSDMFCNSVPG